MKFVSTRGGAPPTSLSDAIAAGLAPDGGLYVPETIPTLVADDFVGCDDLASVATRLLEPYFAGDRLAAELAVICRESFDFPTPFKAVPDDTSILELFHGPTAAFKDVGARFLAACLARLQAGNDHALTILVATSGDTGAAVAAAFHRRPGLRVVVLYPDGRVSPRQAHQLGCFGGNITALRIAGSFDDCQRLVKQALGDRDLQQQVPLSSANSISLGRLLPQMAYYALASLQHWRATATDMNLVIPTGNLGNGLAAILARAMGLPIGDIALATNANRVLPEFFAGNDYAARDSVTTLANAMDVGAPSNVERLRWLYPDDAVLRGAFRVESVSDDEIAAAIGRARSQWGEVICPHTATAATLLERLRADGDSRAWTVVATAHPAKFDTIVEPLLGQSVAVPPALAALLDRPAFAEPMAPAFAALSARLQALDAG